MSGDLEEPEDSKSVKNAPEELGLSRRGFLNRLMIVSAGLGLASAFGVRNADALTAVEPAPEPTTTDLAERDALTVDDKDRLPGVDDSDVDPDDPNRQYVRWGYRRRYWRRRYRRYWRRRWRWGYRRRWGYRWRWRYRRRYWRRRYRRYWRRRW
jgi:hypothetical protein